MKSFHSLSKSFWESHFHNIARDGKEFMLSVKEEFSTDIDELDIPCTLSYLMARGLDWSFYSKNEVPFIEYASKFITKDILVKNDIVEKYHGMYGVNDLKGVLITYRVWFNKMKADNFDIMSATMGEIIQSFRKYYNWIDTKKQSVPSMIIGEWFFSYVYFVVLIMREELWDEFPNDTIFLPAGKTVVKNMRKLAKDNCPFLTNFPNPSKNESISDKEIFAFTTRIAKETGVSALKLNAGLYAKEV